MTLDRLLWSNEDGQPGDGIAQEGTVDLKKASYDRANKEVSRLLISYPARSDCRVWLLISTGVSRRGYEASFAWCPGVRSVTLPARSRVDNLRYVCSF